MKTPVDSRVVSADHLRFHVLDSHAKDVPLLGAELATHAAASSSYSASEPARVQSVWMLARRSSPLPSKVEFAMQARQVVASIATMSTKR